MDLSIIIVNWNSVSLLKKCLISIKNNLTKIKYEVLVIDNASFDGSERLVQNEFADMSFIQNGTNDGFAKANNIAFAKSKGDYILFLNPDTELFDSSIENMLSFIKNKPSTGLVGCKLLNADLTIQDNSIRKFPTIFNQMLDIDIIKKLIPSLSLWEINHLYTNKNIPIEVDAISGACMMVKKSVFEEIGGFNEQFFMYSEDIELCYKIRKTGYSIYLKPDANIIHHGGKSSEKSTISSFAVIQMKKSKYIYFKMIKGSTYANIYKFTMLFSAILRLSILFVYKKLLLLLNRREINLQSIEKWKAVYRWALN